MADRYRGTLYVGVTADLAVRIHQHREGRGSELCRRYGLARLVWAERCDTIAACIAHEKRLKRWRPEWKIALFEKASADWADLLRTLFQGGEAGPRVRPGVTRKKQWRRRPPPTHRRRS
ncbi:GIY-YIG nuclease family protein [Sphingomonas ginkgonis]|uniref:GIY-YIG nuclease family protein n=1 Tax=Sphingomonas ginkgonis TaxID=2315330 RepID=A0A3R9WQQ4_9SPHN|nr:GIY-YIG nuclease family protein [Sphingomonas ginkgonis]